MRTYSVSFSFKGYSIEIIEAQNKKEIEDKIYDKLLSNINDVEDIEISKIEQIDGPEPEEYKLAITDENYILIKEDDEYSMPEWWKVKDAPDNWWTNGIIAAILLTDPPEWFQNLEPARKNFTWEKDMLPFLKKINNSNNSIDMTKKLFLKERDDKSSPNMDIVDKTDDVICAIQKQFRPFVQNLNVYYHKDRETCNSILSAYKEDKLIAIIACLYDLK